MANTIIGIDLGTTNSLCSIFEDGQAMLVPNCHGSLLTPSIVGLLDDGQLVVGDLAKELRISKPKQAAWCFKRVMGTEEKISVGKQEFSPVELSSLVLQNLKEDAEKFLGHAVDEAVITVPAYFNDFQRKATQMAGQLAGLKVRRIINEPTAAALTYGFHEQDADKSLLVFDLGGGTFDVTVMEIFEGSLEIMSSAGESMLGGEDFTEKIISWACEKKNLDADTVREDYPEMYSRLLHEAEKAKRSFSSNDTYLFQIPNLNGSLENAESVEIDHQLFAIEVDDLMAKLARPVARALRDAELQPSSIEDVILVGGATRMPIIKDFVEDFFGKEALCKFNPDQVVALGASIQAALIRDDKAVSDMVMTDVCPFTLGTSISKSTRGGGDRHGYFLPVIHRNTTIPVSREEIVYTLHADQTEVLVDVYQGESRRVEKNIRLGELKVNGIPPSAEGSPVHIRFTYDLNGVLDVEAYIPGTQKRFQTVLTNHVSGMSEKEVQLALQKMKELKFYPRDKVENRRLLLFGENVLEELSRFQREELEEYLDSFEHALDANDQEHFKVSQQNLLMCLSRMGVPYSTGQDGE